MHTLLSVPCTVSASFNNILINFVSYFYSVIFIVLLCIDLGKKAYTDINHTKNSREWHWSFPRVHIIKAHLSSLQLLEGTSTSYKWRIEDHIIRGVTVTIIPTLTTFTDSHRLWEMHVWWTTHSLVSLDSTFLWPWCFSSLGLSIFFMFVSQFQSRSRSVFFAVKGHLTSTEACKVSNKSLTRHRALR